MKTEVKIKSDRSKPKRTTLIGLESFRDESQKMRALNFGETGAAIFALKTVVYQEQTDKFHREVYHKALWFLYKP